MSENDTQRIFEKLDKLNKEMAELVAHDRTKRAIGLHVDTCPGSTKFAKTASAAVIEQPHGLAKWILLLTPWRWPAGWRLIPPNP